jgi:hypothetical protein
MGSYDLLKDPLVITPGWEYICYSNNKNLRSNVWKIIYMNLQDVKQLRKLKIITPFEYDTCIWIDASIEVRCNLDDFIRDNHQSYFTLMKHPHRGCVYMEAEACVVRRKDNEQVIRDQMTYYRSLRYPSNDGMVATGLLIRNNCKQVKDFCERWWSEVERFSRRDQLSFNFTAHQFPIKYTLISFNVLEKEFYLYLHHNSKIL